MERKLKRNNFDDRLTLSIIFKKKNTKIMSDCSFSNGNVNRFLMIVKRVSLDFKPFFKQNKTEEYATSGSGKL